MIRSICGLRVILTPLSKVNVSTTRASKCAFAFSNLQKERLTPEQVNNLIIEQQQKLTEQVIEIFKADKQYTEEDLKYVGNVNESDWQAFLDEVHEQKKSSSKAQNIVNENGQKIIYQTEERVIHVLRYQILAAVFGLATLYLLYRGDAQYKTILTVPAVAVAFYLVAKHNTHLRNIPQVRQILEGRDGSYEFIIERNRILSTIEKVQPKNIKYHTLLYNPRIGNNVQSVFPLPNQGFKIFKPLPIGFSIQINDHPAILPFEYRGNALDFGRVLTRRQ